MKLWKIKAQALRIMFADTDIQFSEEEFSSGVLITNGNTMEKLVLMEDSIRRGIDRYYEIVGEQRGLKEFDFDVTKTFINVASEATFGIPERVDIRIYDVYTNEEDEEVTTLHTTHRQVNFIYDQIGGKIFFDDQDYSEYKTVDAMIWYKRKPLNLPYTIIDQMTFDLDTLYIPENVQRMLPYFVKGELYEEDEPAVAQTAMAMYINFLRGLKKSFSNVQTKVKRSKIFEKDN